MTAYPPPIFSVAPMIEWTDRHCRYLHRLLSRRARLYTEMIVASGVVRGDRRRLLGFHPAEHPVALQLGGADPETLAEAARIGEEYGYDEINLNVGCPSDRVQSGRFGACLMAEPALVASSVAAMKRAVAIPVTVKCRIGIDDQDIEAPLDAFADGLVASGVDMLIVHARKAWLEGLSPRENREIPPLDYQRVYRLAARLAPLPVILNGGIPDLDAAEAHLAHVSGVMLGRAVYNQPMLLAQVDRRFYRAAGDGPVLDEIVAAMADYAEAELGRGTRLNAIARHMLGLASFRPGARRFRQILSMQSVRPGAGPDIFFEALRAVEDDAAAA